MTSARKIGALFILIALFLTLSVTFYTAQREYTLALAKIAAVPLAKVPGQVDLQAYFYKKDRQTLETKLSKYLRPKAVLFAAAYGGQGEVLARVGQNKLRPLNTLRLKSSTADTELIALDTKGKPAKPGFWAALTKSDTIFHLSIPVFSSFNPTKPGVSDLDIATAVIDSNASGGSQGSQLVIGYMYFGISQGELLASVWPKVASISLLFLGILLLPGIAVFLVTRRLSRSISQLAELTHEVTSGKREKSIDIKGDSDIENMANMLNTVIGQEKQRKSDDHLKNQVLSLKVDEHSSQLSKRDQELNSATKEITETKNRLQKLAYYDTLTSLPNRRLFTEQLGLLLRINERNKSNLALLLINLENFKRINDSLGHDTGDIVLRETAKRLTECLRGSDTVAYQKESKSKIDISRLDGDEFTVVLNQLTSADDIGIVAQRIIEKLIEPMTIAGTELVITPNIGIAVSPGDATQVQGLFSAASAAMNHAQDSKQANYLFYEPGMDLAGAERIKLEADLRKAVERNELLLHYQPQVDTVTGAVTGAEALLRWQHPELGLVPPYKFISLAEEIGIINELGDWVMKEACRQMKSFQDQGLKLPKIAINVSAMQFSSKFTKRVKAVLHKLKLPPSMLELGLAESIMTDNDGSTIEALEDLKNRGVYLSVDDFGTSYSPMNYLSRYPLNEIKIDRSFVAGCDQSEGSANLVIAIIAMAAALKLNTVAEGVETEDQYRFLKSSGATIMQGYFFSKPVTAQELEGMLAPWYFAEKIQRISV